MEASNKRTEGGRGRVSTESALAVFTPKFKRCRVSTVRVFQPECERVIASNYGLTMSAVRDFSLGCRRVTASNYGGGAQDYLVLYMIRCVTIYPALIVTRLKAKGPAFGHMGVRTCM
ncbi:hypothetical protein J1N35_011445 [Gossypium stocksii]|uniref:Uncharacterized protein n=1 Tax=Gossypium stocksii TaxID=47602 RepID=A0A9D3W2S1_9ROSI|nr:hypothetical protein J1N35_011445 [Gossypium stocksii]